MKKVLRLLTISVISMTVIFTSCKKEKDMLDKTPQAIDISLKSQEPDIIVKGGGEKEDYTKVVVEELVKAGEDCKWEFVSGIVEFYYLDEMVFSVDFGDGTCDGVATVSWIENNTLLSKEVEVWSLFQKNKYVIIEELVKNPDCDYQIVSGVIEYQDKEGIPYVSVDFGNGACDGIATKCLSKEGVTECEDFDIEYWTIN